MSSSMHASTVPFAPEKLHCIIRAHADDMRGEAVARVSSLENTVSCL